VRARWLALVLLAASRWGAAALPITLPIYLEDNHAGSFYWLAEHLDLDEECNLIHFDAHSDASALFDSDRVREGLRRVASVEDRRELLGRWRQTGAIQCFNWIEPLMPAPISKMIWVPRRTLSQKDARLFAKEAGEFFDGQIEAAPRAAGPFRGRCEVVGFNDLVTRFKEEGPVIVTIDLDYFAGMGAKAREVEFERVWKFVAERRNLRAVTFAISRPYLASDEEADALVRLALRASLSLPTAAIQFEPFAKVANDRSLRARQLRAEKREVPLFEVAKASEELRALLLASRRRIAVLTDSTRWQETLRGWDNEAPRIHLALRDHDPSTDEIWRLPVAESAEIELQTEPWDRQPRRVEWFVLTPEHRRCNLIAARADEIGFGRGAPPRPRWRDTKLAGGRTLPVVALRKFFDPQTGCGSVRLRARVEIEGRVRETQAIEIRRFAGEGFRAALTEQFQLPYLFGSGGLRDGTNTGPETTWGADCANFLVYALRRQGRPIPWCNPKQFRKYLEPVRQEIGPGEGEFTADDVAAGLFVHFGSHVAAVIEDRPPMGRLDESDLVAHQLEGAPEMVSLGKLIRTRSTPRFDLLRLPRDQAAPDVMVGGDVMLGRTVGEEIKRGADPFHGIRRELERAPVRVVNLECVVSSKGTAPTEKPYLLRAPEEAVRVLAAAGISGVGLANNHAFDFGTEALMDSLRLLRANGLEPLGAAETPERVYAPGFFSTRDERKIAIVALDAIENAPAEGLIARASNRERIARTIREARARAEFVLCLVHWGDENTARVNGEQRELARWLIDQQVDVVVGAHPHCLQPLDYYHGHPIVYSLGNLIFDGAPTSRKWSEGALAAVGFGHGVSRDFSLQLLPVTLDACGFPHTARSSEKRLTAEVESPFAFPAF